jgi:hypothetical protein
MGHYAPRPLPKRTFLELERDRFIAGHIALDEFEARVASLLLEGRADEPVPHSPPLLPPAHEGLPLVREWR